MIDLSLNSKSKLPSCKGIFFRGYDNIFYSGGRLEQKRGYRLLKRMSCQGCESCGWLRDEAIIEEVSNLIDLGEIKDYGLYELTVKTTGGGSSWDGNDDYDYELVFNLVDKK